MEKNKQSSKALEETEIGNLKPNKKEEVLEKIIKNDEQSRGGNYCTVQDTSIAVAEESKDSEFVLPSQQISESDFQSNFSFSSEHLSEVPVEYTLQPLVSDDELKDQVRVTLKEHLIGNTGQSAHVETHNQKMLPDGPSKLSLSPTSVPDNVSPGPSSALQERKLSPIENGNNPCLAEQDRQNSSPKLLSAPKLKISTDGYNWRKYGQKQVKSPEGSRSYYRCTFSDCNAKKIEFCDQFGNVIEIVYRNHHNHDPPQKVNCTRESRHTSSVLPANGSDNAAHPLRAINDYSVEKPVMEMAQIPETSQQETTNSDEIVEISTKEEHVNELEHKKRQKKSVTGDMVTITKPGKKPKTVVEEAGDVGISGDGYRWRKYGQKMVKGNLHPRNYYRCTSAGCPVRKHTERATDSSSAVIISYTGEHDHDMPVPKKTRGPTTDSLIATASPGPTNNLQINETEV